MPYNEDRDVKVFYPSAEKKRNSEKDILEIAEILDNQRSNGNLLLARKLGEHLAAIKPENAGELDGIDLEKAGIDVDKLESNVLYQIRVLMTFAAQITLHSVLPSVLSSEAVNIMYNKMRDKSEAFYDNLTDGTSFSFYYLAIRKGINIEENIGKNFAMLCGDEDEEELINLGKTVYTLSNNYIKELVKSYNFKF